MSTFIQITNHSGIEMVINAEQIEHIVPTKDPGTCHIYMVGDKDSHIVAMHSLGALAYGVNARELPKAYKKVDPVYPWSGQ